LSVFEFTATLFGIVVALAMARTLGGIADLIRYRSEIRHKPLFLIWFSFLLLGNVVWWFSLWRRSESNTVSLYQFGITLLVPVCFFIATRLLVPDESNFRSIEERYRNIRVPFLLLLAIPFFPGPILGGIVLSNWSIGAYLIPAGLLLVCGTLSPNIRLQYSIAMSVTLIYLAFAVQFRSSIGS
jgi:hypothetical protein